MFQTFGRLSNKATLALVVCAALQVSGCGSPEDRARSYVEHGMKLLAEHDNERASVEFRNAVKIKKDMVEAWRGLAQIAEFKQQWPDLVAILKTILEIEPNNLNEQSKARKNFVAWGFPRRGPQIGQSGL